MTRKRSAPGLAIALALLGATLAAYHGVLASDFVNLDDGRCITEVPELHAGLTRESVRWALTRPHCANWFPLTTLSWMLDAEVHGLSARGVHAANLALHAANALLALAAFTRLTGSLGVGAFTAGVFALHPLHVESVAWAVSRKDVLAGFFWLLGLLAYERWVRAGPTPARGAALVLCLVLGLLSKPVLVALPFVLLLLDVWPLRRLRGANGWERAQVRRAVLEKAPLFAIAALFSALVVAVQSGGGAVRALEQFPLGVRLANAVVACATYLRRAVLPNDLAVFYPHPGDTLGAGQVAAAAAVLLAASALVAWQWRRRPQLAVGWLWWLVTLAPTIGIVQVGQAALADRYAYLAQSGLVLALAATAAPLAARGRAARAATWAVALAVLLAFGVATAAQVRVWRSSETLFLQALRVTTRNHVALVNLAGALVERGEIDGAARHLEAALRIEPNSPPAHGLLGNVLLEQGRHAEAARELEIAVRAEPDATYWLQSLGVAWLELGRTEEAIDAWQQVLAREPDSASLRGHLGDALAKVGRLPEALAQLDEATRLAPNDADLAGLHARLLDRAGRVPEAIAAYRRALALGADAPDLRNNLAWWLIETSPGDERVAAEAVALAEQAVAGTGGQDASMLDTLATAYAAAGRSDDARRTAARALAAAEASAQQ